MNNTLLIFDPKNFPLTGVYTLILFVSKSFEIIIGKLGKKKISEGYYTYTGSALNIRSSNLQKRISRHLLKNKKKFWHIDFILQTKDVKVITITASNLKYKVECEINQFIKNNTLSIIPIRGLGSSDCKKNCSSHFFYFGKKNPTSKIIKLYSKKFKDSTIYVLKYGS